jgi:hypothetical protein
MPPPRSLFRLPADPRRIVAGVAAPSIAAGGEGMHHPGGVTISVIRAAQMNS